MNILGGGLAGLILGYLLDAPVYDLCLGGQMVGFCKGPRILEADESSRELVRALGIKEEPRIFRVGYVTEKGIRAGNELSETARQSYYKKTRGSEAAMPESVMSGGKSTLLGWDLKDLDLVNLLSKRVKLQEGVVIKVDFENRLVRLAMGDGTKRELPITDCISTIPLNRLMQLFSISPMEVFYLTKDQDGSVVKPHFNLNDLDFSNHDTTFIRTDLSDKEDPRYFSNTPKQFVNSGYDYLYFVEDNNPLNRVTRTSEDYLVFEFRGDRFEDAVRYLEKRNYTIGMVHTIRACQLVNSYNILEIGYERPEYYRDTLKLCGRYARWNHKIKLNDIIMEGKAYAESLGR